MTTVLAPGTLTLAATPIGNPLDASVRLVRALAEAEVIAAEDTRRLARLAAQLEVTITGSVFSYHDHNEHERTNRILEALESGKSVLIVSDAGMPTVSDPGYRAVHAAADAGHAVSVIPGPSAVLTALSVSALATDRFTFEGFVPRHDGKRRSMFTAVANDPRTLIFFDSPRRTASTLASMRSVFGDDRPATVARELTKTHEEVLRGTLAQLDEWAHSTEVLGEIVIVVAGADPAPPAPSELLPEVSARVAAGERLKDASKAVAAEHPGVSTRDLYEAALAEQKKTR